MPHSTLTRRRREAGVASPDSGRWKAFIVSFAILFAMMTLWALATPLMASPDEPSHAIRAAAVVRGDLTGTPSSSGTSTIVRVPSYLAKSDNLKDCYFTRTDLPASCQVFSNDDTIVDADTFSTLNTPVFYAIVGLPTLVLDGNPAIYAMRVMSAGVTAALLALAFVMLRAVPRARWSVAGGIVAVTPMVVFLGGTINPNAWEIAAAAALFSALVVVFRSAEVSKRIFTERILLVTFATFVLVNTRSIALIWLLVIVIVALVFAKAEALKLLARRRATWVGVAICGAATVGAGWWYLLPKGLVQIQGVDTVGKSWQWAVSTMFDRTLDYGHGWIGIFGWLDTPAPALTFAIWAAALVAIIVAALSFGSGRGRLMVSLLIVAVLVIPMAIQASLIADWGFVWQGRYSLALFVCVILACGIAIDERDALRSTPKLRSAFVVGLSALALAHAAAFLWALRRYVVGFNTVDTWFAMFSRPLWQPVLPWELVMVLFVIVLAAGVAVAARWLGQDRPLDQVSAVQEAPAAPRSLVESGS